MRFQLLDILPHYQNPVTGRLVSTAERYSQAITAAQRAEQLGFDAVALGERHAGPFLSSGITRPARGDRHAHDAGSASRPA